jgi:hypothetical protein
MNKTRFHLFRSLALLSLISLLNLSLFAPAAAQTASISTLNITKIISADFPQVVAQVQAFDSTGAPVSGINASDLKLKEDGIEVSLLAVDRADVGVQVAFAVEPGAGLSSSGFKFTGLFEEARTRLDDFLSHQMRDSVDSVTIVVQDRSGPKVLVPMTSTVKGARDPLFSFQTSDEIATNSTAATLNTALDELINSPGGADKPKWLFIFTSGVRDEDLKRAQDKALKANIPVYVVLMRTAANEFWARDPQALAAATNGEFLPFWTSPDLNKAYAKLTALRAQWHLTYRSTSASTDSRTLTVELASNESIASSATFKVNVQPPVVGITEPGPGALFDRNTTQEGTAPEAIEPTSATVVAAVEFDQFPRDLKSATLFANDEKIGELTGPTDSGHLEFSWDLRGFQTGGQTDVRLRVEVEDELGLVAQSDDTNVTVAFTPAPTPVGITTLPCPDFINDNLPALCPFVRDTFQLLTFALAAAALIVALLIYLNRGAVVQVAARAGEAVSQMVEAVTQRVKKAQTAKAFLIALEGVEDTGRNTFEIYGTTPIGRSKQYAQLLFQVNDPNSVVSRLHCTIIDEDDGTFKIRDEGSANGTFVNSIKLRELELEPLQDGDTIELGETERGGVKLLFQIAAGDEDGSGDNFTKPVRHPDSDGSETANE